MKHLGLLTSFNRAKKENYKEVLERINKKLEGWKSKLLSQVGRTMLIRIMASTIPLYQMSLFLLPKSTCKSLDVK